MTETAPATGLRKWWADRAWKTGERLDNMGRWLLLHAPAGARLYARVLSSRPRRPRVFPGWTFAYKYFIERRWLALRRGALWEFALERNLAVPLVVRWLAGTRVDVTLGNDNSLCLFVAGSFEPNEFAFLDRALRRDMTFIDVGANEGYFALFAARRVGWRGRVLAVEPSSRERRQLERNVRRNRLSNVTIVPHALGHEAGSGMLRIAAKLHGGHNTLGDFAHKEASTAGTEVVPIETLDALVERLAVNRVDVIKIDVEGAELKVLNGARGLLTTMRPVMLIEANDSALRGQGASNAALLELLRTLRYEVRVFSDRTGEVEPFDEDGPLSANIVALPLP